MKICCLRPPAFHSTKTHILKPRQTFVQIETSSHSSCLLAPSLWSAEPLLPLLHIRAGRKHNTTLPFRDQPRLYWKNQRTPVLHPSYFPVTVNVFSHTVLTPAAQEHIPWPQVHPTEAAYGHSSLCSSFQAPLLVLVDLGTSSGINEWLVRILWRN